jgi:MerR family transcriptional regulator/heat shock protein HspR
MRRIIELEDEVLRLRRELVKTREETREAVERTHRHYRRDLVPLSNTPAVWEPRRRSGG